MAMLVFLAPQDTHEECLQPEEGKLFWFCGYYIFELAVQLFGQPVMREIIEIQKFFAFNDDAKSDT